MTRPLRINVEGGWYHVGSRGNNRQAIYLDRRDREHFLELVGELPERFGLEIHSYVMMDNHYHLLIRTPEANASQAIQWLNVSYSVWWNRRHERSGHLFQGRFKGILVEGGAWVLELSLYLHFNPVAVKELGLGKQGKARTGAGLAKPTPALLRKRLEVLRGYPWSSYRGFAGYVKAPSWLMTKEILNRVKGGREGYRKQAEMRVGQGVEEGVWVRLHWGSVLGSERFAEQMRQKLKMGRETHGRSRVRPRTTWEEVVRGVERIKGESWEHFKGRYGDWGRDLVLWMVRRQGRMTLEAIGERAGGMDYSSVAVAIRRIDRRMKENEELRRIAEQVENELCNVKM